MGGIGPTLVAVGRLQAAVEAVGGRRFPFGSGRDVLLRLMLRRVPSLGLLLLERPHVLLILVFTKRKALHLVFLLCFLLVLFVS